VSEFDEPTVAIIKHTNPCGVGSAQTLSEAYGRAFATDRKSSFGGIVAMNRELDLETAERIDEVFTEVIVAPRFPETVLDFLRRKKDRRVVRMTAEPSTQDELEIRSVPGGLLLQEHDRTRAEHETFTVVSARKPTEKELKSMLYAWRVVKHVRSNAVVYATTDRTLGIGAGQMSRVDSVRLAARKAADAGLDLHGSALASDAFFPFADGLMEGTTTGASAVIQPGGSIRDHEVIRAADDNHIAMVFTGRRHFKH
jgi:phosphoribosylaminoimidazolecarboxamide formyltransferase/IMP cyclohydrolase